MSVTAPPVTTVPQRDFKDRPRAKLPAKSGKRTIEKQVSRSKKSRKQIAVRLPRNLSRGKQFAPSDNRRHAQASGVSGATSTGRRLVVALNGSTKFRSIQQAINNANPGDTVVVKPGAYRERFILDKPLKLVGDGPVNAIVIESVEHHWGQYVPTGKGLTRQPDPENAGAVGQCLWVKAKKIFVKGLSFRGMVKVTGGVLTIEDCDLSASGNCLTVTGQEAKAELSRCKIHGSRKGAGVQVSNNGSVELKNCDIFQNEGDGLRVFDGGNAIAQKCRFNDSRHEHGIHVYQRGHVTITKCRVFQNSAFGIRVSKAGTALIQDSKITLNRGYGISVGEEAKVQIVDCDLLNNSRGSRFFHGFSNVSWVNVLFDDGNDSVGTTSSTTTEQIALPASPAELKVERHETPTSSETDERSLSETSTGNANTAPLPTTIDDAPSSITATDSQAPTLASTEEVEPVDEQPTLSVVEPEPIVSIAEQVVVEAEIAESVLPPVELIRGATGATVQVSIPISSAELKIECHETPPSSETDEASTPETSANSDNTAPSPPTNKQYVVSLDGPSDFRSVQQAIDAAALGDTIVLKPGVYRETLVLNKSLTLIGDGSRDDIVIESSYGNCLCSTAKDASLKGFSFRSNSETAVVVTDGEILIEDCNMQANRHCLFVEGNTATVRIQGCRIHDSVKGCGIRIVQHGTATIERCEVYQNAQSGIQVSEQGHARILRSRLFENQLSGVTVETGGEGDVTIEHCHIYGSCNSSGVLVVAMSKVTIEDSRIYRNKRANLLIAESSSATIQRCQIRESHDGEGVRVASESIATVLDCEISLNKLAGISVDAGAQIRVHGCRIWDTREDHGVRVGKQCLAEFVDCDICQNKDSGVWISGESGDEKSRTVIQNCQIRDNREGFGIVVCEWGNATITQCHIVRNTVDGIRVCESSSAIIQSSEITLNRGYGVSIDEAQIEAIDCDLRSNSRGSHSVDERSKAEWEKVLVDSGLFNFLAILHELTNWLLEKALSVSRFFDSPNELADATSCGTTGLITPKAVTVGIAEWPGETSLPASESMARSKSPIDLAKEIIPTQTDSEVDRLSLPVVALSRDDIAPPPVERFHNTVIEWIPRLLASALFEKQKQTLRTAPANELTEKLLRTLDQSGGKMMQVALARALDYSDMRLPGLIAIVGRIVNIDGSRALHLDELSETVELNRDLLLMQFELD